MTSLLHYSGVITTFDCAQDFCVLCSTFHYYCECVFLLLRAVYEAATLLHSSSQDICDLFARKVTCIVYWVWICSECMSIYMVSVVCRVWVYVYTLMCVWMWWCLPDLFPNSLCGWSEGDKKQDGVWTQFAKAQSVNILLSITDCEVSWKVAKWFHASTWSSVVCTVQRALSADHVMISHSHGDR